MDVIIDNEGFSIILVASNLPPNPTSRTTASASMNLRKASAVVSSKKVAGMELFRQISKIFGSKVYYQNEKKLIF